MTLSSPKYIIRSQVNFLWKIELLPLILPLSLSHTLWHIQVALTKDTIFAHSLTFSWVIWLALANGMWIEVAFLFYILRFWYHYKKHISKLGHQSIIRWEIHRGELNPPNSLQASLTNPSLDSLTSVDLQLCEWKQCLPLC